MKLSKRQREVLERMEAGESIQYFKGAWGSFQPASARLDNVPTKVNMNTFRALRDGGMIANLGTEHHTTRVKSRHTRYTITPEGRKALGG